MYSTVIKNHNINSTCGRPLHGPFHMLPSVNNITKEQDTPLLILFCPELPERMAEYFNHL